MTGPRLPHFRLLQIRRVAQLMTIAALSGLVVSCGLQRQGDGLKLPPAAMIQDVRITEGTEKTIVEIEGEEPMIYTTFRLSDPDRLIIDMAEVDLSRFADEIQVENGPIRAIRPGSGGGSNVSRLEFELSGVVETDVRTEGLNLVVEVTQVAAAPKGFRFFEDETPTAPPVDTSETVEMTADAALPTDISPDALPGLPEPGLSNDLPDIAIEVTETDPEVAAPDLLPLQKTEPIQADAIEKKETLTAALPEGPTADEKEVSLQPAQKVSGLRFEPGESLKLIVSSDGVLSPRTFFIGFGNKRRLVIDLPGVRMASKPNRISVDDHRVKQVRVGQHKKKLRLVLDLLSPISYDLAQRGSVLEVSIKGPEKAADESAPPEANLHAAAHSEMPQDAGTPSAGADTEKAGAESEASGADVGMKLSTLALPLASPSIASAATLPPPLPVPDAESEEDSNKTAQAEQTIEAETPQADAPPEGPQAGESPVPLRSEAASGDDGLMQPVDTPNDVAAPAPAESVSQKTDEVSEIEKTTSTPDSPAPAAPGKAEVTFSPSEAPPAAPLSGLPDEAEKKSEAEAEKLEKEKAAKKKVILRRKRREAAAAKREALALAQAAQAEEAPPAKVEKYTGRKISLDFQDAEITNVVRLIADVSGLNFVMGDDVKGKITLKMNDVPWDQALDIILEIRNLGMVRDGDIIRIATLANLTRQRNEQAEARETKIRAEELLTRVIYINYAKADKMKTLLLKLLSARGEIMVADRVNALVVKDVADSLNQVEQMANKLDTKTPQVLIEARIVEVQPTFKKSLGVQWGADFKTNRDGNRIGIGNFSGPGSTIFNPVSDFSVNLPAASPVGGVGFSFGRFTESPFQLDLRISAGESQEMTRIVSTPKIMVLDNNEALIKQGAKIPFQTSSPNGGTNTRLVDANLELKVIPHISPDGGILLELNLTKNQPGPPVAGATQPSIFQKEVSTQILLMDGETMVIGGIYETQKTESKGGIPFFKDIPGLGWLFKNKETSESTTELLIFITPTVMS